MKGDDAVEFGLVGRDRCDEGRERELDEDACFMADRRGGIPGRGT